MASVRAVGIERWGRYREPAMPVAGRLAALVAKRRLELEAFAQRLSELGGRRIGRMAGGLAGIAMALGMFGTSAHPELRSGALPTALLAMAGPVAAVCYAAGRFAGPALLARWLARAALGGGGSPHHRLARLEELGSTEALVRRVHRALEPWSLALPMMALSLLMPLTLHLVFCVGKGALDARFSDLPRAFSGWIALSGLIVGHAHLFLAAACARYAFKLRAQPPELDSRHGWQIWGLTIAVSAMPGLALVGIPPGLTAITGIVFIPAMFSWARQTVALERDHLDLGAAAAGCR